MKALKAYSTRTFRQVWGISRSPLPQGKVGQSATLVTVEPPPHVQYHQEAPLRGKPPVHLVKMNFLDQSYRICLSGPHLLIQNVRHLLQILRAVSLQLQSGQYRPQSTAILLPPPRHNTGTIRATGSALLLKIPLATCQLELMMMHTQDPFLLHTKVVGYGDGNLQVPYPTTAMQRIQGRCRQSLTSTRLL